MGEAAGEAALSLSLALLLAVMADRQIKGANGYKTLLIWPYAVAPAIAAVLWLFMFQPSLGVVARGIRALGIDWNPLLNGTHAMILVIMAATWKQVSYNFLFFLAGLQSIPRSVIEAAAIDGAAWASGATLAGMPPSLVFIMTTAPCSASAIWSAGTSCSRYCFCSDLRN